MKKLKILIDTTPLLKNLTGIGYVTFIYANALSKISNCVFFYAWFYSKNLRNRPLGGLENKINFIKKYLPRPYILTHFIKTIIFNMVIFCKRPNLIFQPNYNVFKTYKKIPTIIIIHDLSHIRYSAFHPTDRVRYFNENLSYSSKIASRIVAISNFTKQEIVELNIAKEDKVEVIYNGVSENFKPLNLHKNDEIFFQKYNLKPKEYFLFVGTFEPRKNINLLLEAYLDYCGISADPTPLVLVGTVGWNEEVFSENLQKALSLPSVFRLGYLSDEELAISYAGAKVFIFPSFYEGFGLPPLEAMASGTAVITSNTSSLPEVVGNAGVLIDPNSKKQLLENMILLDENEEQRKTFEQKGIIQAKKFNWEKSAKKLKTLCKQVVDDS